MEKKIGKGQLQVKKMVKKLQHKSQYGAGDVKQDGLFLPPEVMAGLFPAVKMELQQTIRKDKIHNSKFKRVKSVLQVIGASMGLGNKDEAKMS